MHVLIVGGTGLVGRHLTEHAQAAGHRITVCGRSTMAPSASQTDAYHEWDTASEFAPPDGIDAIVNLAGASIAGKRWTERYKQTMRASRIETNNRIADWIQDTDAPPSVFVTASAVGYYGRAPAGPVDETSGPGDDYLARLCVDWEDAANAASDATRVVAVRCGVVLDKNDAALAFMLPPFRMGVGGIVGNGRQPFPWITADDIARVYLRAIEDDQLSGAINGVSPGPVTNQQFTKALGKALHRPTLFPVPGLALKAMFGDGASIILEGQDVVPTRLRELGFSWNHPEIDEALAAVLAA